jgi:hypothetical protein
MLRWLDRLASCGSPELWRRIHTTMLVVYAVNAPFFLWWAITVNEQALLIQLGALTVTTAIESSAAGLHAASTEQKQDDAAPTC